MTDNNTDAEFSSMQEKNEQTLADIKNLQQIEQDLYDSLETNATNNTLSDAQKTQIVNKINEISQMKMNLYEVLKNIYSFFQKNVASSRTTLAEQMMAIDIVENELKESKRRLQLLEDEKYNKLRMVQVNTYYGKRYSAHASIMKTVVFVCVPILILTILMNSGILPQNIGALLIAILIMIGIIAILYQFVDLSKRDNMNFDEYDWHFNAKDAPTDITATSGNAENDPWATATSVCMGSQCCTVDSTYNAEQNICVPNTTTTTTTV
jgi:hypothetical protein